MNQKTKTNKDIKMNEHIIGSLNSELNRLASIIVAKIAAKESTGYWDKQYAKYQKKLADYIEDKS